MRFFWVLLSWWQNQSWTQLPFCQLQSKEQMERFSVWGFCLCSHKLCVLLKNRFYSAKLRNLSWTCPLHLLTEYNGIDPLELLNPGLKCSHRIFCFCSGRSQTQYKMSRLYVWIEKKAMWGRSEGSDMCGSPSDTARKEAHSSQPSQLSETIWNILAELMFSMCVFSCSVVFSSLRPSGLQSIRLLCSWYFSDKNMEWVCHFILQVIFLTQGLNPVSCISRQILYHWVTREAHFCICYFLK